MRFITHVRAFLHNDQGQDLLEYALLVALVALVCVLAVTQTGTQVNVVFERIRDALIAANA